MAAEIAQRMDRLLWETPIGAALFAWFTFAVRDNPTTGWTIYVLGWVGPLLVLGWCIARRTSPWKRSSAPVLIGLGAGAAFWIFYG